MLFFRRRHPEFRSAAGTPNPPNRIAARYATSAGDSLMTAKKNGYPNGYPFFFGGATRNRTGDKGFADPCLTAWPWRRDVLAYYIKVNPVCQEIFGLFWKCFFTNQSSLGDWFPETGNALGNDLPRNNCATQVGIASIPLRKAFLPKTGQDSRHRGRILYYILCVISFTGARSRLQPDSCSQSSSQLRFSSDS